MREGAFTPTNSGEKHRGTLVQPIADSRHGSQELKPTTPELGR